MYLKIYLSYPQHSPRDIFAPWVVQDSVGDDEDCAENDGQHFKIMTKMMPDNDEQEPPSTPCSPDPIPTWLCNPQFPTNLTSLNYHGSLFDLQLNIQMNF